MRDKMIQIAEEKANYDKNPNEENMIKYALSLYGMLK